MPGLVLFLTWRELQRKLGCGPALVFPPAQPRRIVSVLRGKGTFLFLGTEPHWPGVHTWGGDEHTDLGDQAGEKEEGRTGEGKGRNHGTHTDHVGGTLFCMTSY